VAMEACPSNNWSFFISSPLATHVVANKWRNECGWSPVIPAHWPILSISCQPRWRVKGNRSGPWYENWRRQLRYFFIRTSVSSSTGIVRWRRCSTFWRIAWFTLFPQPGQKICRLPKIAPQSGHFDLIRSFKCIMDNVPLVKSTSLYFSWVPE
jgi:hypothetical protein